jgi:hypothetical protein
MIDQEFIMLIINCKKYVKKALFQKKTWLQLLPPYIKYYHVIGEENMKEEYVFDHENKMLRVKTYDDYISLPNKVYVAYKAVHETFNFKYLFKTDDDQILVNNKFFNILTSLLKTKTPVSHYGGHIVDVKRPYYSKYNRIHPELPDKLPILRTKYCTGRFYYLSKEAIIDLLGKKERIITEYLEDYAIGYYLDQSFKDEILHIKTTMYFTDIEHSDYPKWLEKKII